jgi:DNA polymerase II large subunit
MGTEKYFNQIVENVRKEYDVAEKARVSGFDPVDKVEITLAMSLAEKAVGLISTIYPQMSDDIGKKISNRILELEKEYGQLDTAVSFKIAEEIAREKYCKFRSLLEAIDAGIRLGFAYNTLGVVASPIEGYTGIELEKTKDGKDYFVVNFSGPIRSAGTTATCVVLMLIDYLREIFGFAKYDPDEKEVKRYVSENNDYHERVNNLQYLPTEEEILFLAKNIPIQISGDPTEDKEVSNFKDLNRVKTNFIRGGMCLCFSEGLAQKAAKGWRLLKGVKEKGFVSSGWDFLPDYIELHKKREKGTKDTSATYIKDIVAGRPVFGHPSRSGGFRFRYGRSRTSGFSAVSVHPATMFISNNFLSNGVQLKVEKPTKGCIITSCDKIDGPIVKLKNGSLKKIMDLEVAKKIYREVEEIVYLGDILFPLGDVMNRNSELVRPGYVEEWWGLDLGKAGGCVDNEYNVDLAMAREISEKYKIPLHPNFIYYWSQISKEEFVELMNWFLCAEWRDKIVFPYSKQDRQKYSKAKRALEIAGVEHEVFLDNIVINNSDVFLINLGVEGFDFKNQANKILEISNGKENVLEIINMISKFIIKDKAGEFIGSRMGRPEKAKLRKLTGSPNVLFPVGEQGGRFRSVNEVMKEGFIKSEFQIYYCNSCNREGVLKKCEICGGNNVKKFYCVQCNEIKAHSECELHGQCRNYSNRKVDISEIYKNSLGKIKYSQEQVPILIKGVKGMSNEEHDFEDLAKGILRAKYNLCVNKDGTIRYDATEIPLTHFKPVEIGASVEKLRELGYKEDINGKELVNEDQILILMPHDILLPCCPETKDERADDVFFNIANFLDELLEKLYKLPRFYNLKSKQDLIGQMVVCMAPHNCAGVAGRIIGFSKMQGLVASPFMHAAMRRDCDGDEAAVMMLLDVLLNFSRKFLPTHRGGTQDAPLVLNAHIRAGEVDDQILDFETCSSYPLELYEKAEQKKHSSEIKIEDVRSLLKQNKEVFGNIGFTHDTTNINFGVNNSAYKVLPTMREKVDNQMELVEKIRAVDAADVARLIVERHFIRDIRGNLRKFSHQQFRCSSCNEKYRRVPLSGACYKCGGKIIFTITEGSIRKYLESAINLAEKYKIPDYTKQSLDLAKMYVESVFGKEEVQEKLM